ncbi:hypothetical protein [Alteromonas sp. H39]|uniref:hypothetical protein n=1 Tax=Alteromonas sp. H39 TaxID=3389876 RepID=UPI0039E179B3
MIDFYNSLEFGSIDNTFYFTSSIVNVENFKFSRKTNIYIASKSVVDDYRTKFFNESSVSIHDSLVTEMEGPSELFQFEGIEYNNVVTQTELLRVYPFLRKTSKSSVLQSKNIADVLGNYSLNHYEENALFLDYPWSVLRLLKKLHDVGLLVNFSFITCRVYVFSLDAGFESESSIIERFSAIGFSLLSSTKASSDFIYLTFKRRSVSAAINSNYKSLGSSEDLSSDANEERVADLQRQLYTLNTIMLKAKRDLSISRSSESKLRKDITQLRLKNAAMISCLSSIDNDVEEIKSIFESVEYKNRK